MSHVADRILMLPPALALLLVFLLPALEASAFVGFIIPGEIGVILGGVLANQHKLALWAALVAGIAGAVIGDSVGYEVGRRYGDRLLEKIPNRLLKQKHIDRTKDLVARNGGRAVFIGRFTTALRATGDRSKAQEGSTTCSTTSRRTAADTVCSSLTTYLLTRIRSTGTTSVPMSLDENSDCHGADIDLVGAYGTDLQQLGEHTRRVAATVLSDLLGRPLPVVEPADVHVTVSDIIQGDPRTT